MTSSTCSGSAVPARWRTGPRKTTQAIATLLHTAGVNFAVLGPAETCTGDPARRIGNEFVYVMLAQQNIETLNEAGAAKTIVASCPHCFNTIANEYPQLGGNYEVIHHTQLLARLVERGEADPGHPGRRRRSPTTTRASWAGTTRCSRRPGRSWNRCPASRPQEMHRCKDRGFCCGAGGARMWMEERIGKRINTERIDEALGTSPDTISTACPYCLVMLGDAVSAKKSVRRGRRNRWRSSTWPSCWPARSARPPRRPGRRPPMTGSGQRSDRSTCMCRAPWASSWSSGPGGHGPPTRPLLAGQHAPLPRLAVDTVSQ